MPTSFYATDLAYVHHAGFGSYAERAAPELLHLLRGQGIRGGQIVEFGCGSGTVAGHLAAAGYDVLGVDISPAMIRLAREKVIGARFRVGALATTRIPRCRAIIAIGEVVSYLTPSNAATTTRTHQTNLASFFVRAFNALEPGGLLVFDFTESTKGRTYDTKSTRGEDWAISARATADAAGRTLTREIDTFRKIGRHARRSHEIHRARIYRRNEMLGLLRRAGFRVVMRRSLGSVRLIRSDLIAIAERLARR